MTEYLNPIPPQHQGKNVVIIISRTGSYEERELTDAQLDYVRSCVEQWPEIEK